MDEGHLKPLTGGHSTYNRNTYEDEDHTNGLCRIEWLFIDKDSDHSAPNKSQSINGKCDRYSPSHAEGNHKKRHD